MLLPLFAVFTAILRGLLLFCGFWVNVGALRRCGPATCCVGGFRKSVFLVGNLAYLTALLPFTCCLLVAVPLEAFGCRHWLEPGTTPRIVCWLQTVSCAVAVSVHVGLFLGWLGEAGLRRLFVKRPPRAEVALFVWLSFVPTALYLVRTVRAVSPNTLRHVTWNASVSAPASVQLLLCAESGSASESLTRHALYLSWTLLPGVGVLVIIWTVVAFVRLWTVFRLKEATPAGWSPCTCQSSSTWLQTAVLVLTCVTTCWTVCGRPLLILLSEVAKVAYVDVGSHLILTLSVLLPVTVYSPVFRHEESPKSKEESPCLT